MSAQAEAPQTSQSSLEQYASYPFDSDQVYQQGLASILTNGALSNVTSTEEKDEVLRQTRVFYFNKTTGNKLSLDEVREYEQSRKTNQPEASAVSSLSTTVPNPTSSSTSEQPQADEESRILTFAELKELVENGRLDQIPNNKVIPNDLNEAPPSQSTAQTRKKPWEIAAENLNNNISSFSTGIGQ